MISFMPQIHQRVYERNCLNYVYNKIREPLWNVLVEYVGLPVASPGGVLRDEILVRLPAPEYGIRLGQSRNRSVLTLELRQRVTGCGGRMFHDHQTIPIGDMRDGVLLNVDHLATTKTLRTNYTVPEVLGSERGLSRKLSPTQR